MRTKETDALCTSEAVYYGVFYYDADTGQYCIDVTDHGNQELIGSVILDHLDADLLADLLSSCQVVADTVLLAVAALRMQELDAKLICELLGLVWLEENADRVNSFKVLMDKAEEAL